MRLRFLLLDLWELLLADHVKAGHIGPCLVSLPIFVFLVQPHIGLALDLGRVGEAVHGIVTLILVLESILGVAHL